VSALAGYTGDEASGNVLDVVGTNHFALAGNSQRTAAGSGYLHGGSTPNSKGLTQSSTGTDAGPALFGQTANRSLSMWLKMSADFTGWVFEWHLNTPNSGGWGLLCLSGQLGFRARNAAGNTAFASAARITDNAWHHYAGTFDGTSVRFYTDGSLTATVALTGGGPIDTTNVTLNLFNTTVGTPPVVDDIRVHDHVLTASEISAFMGNPPPDSSGSTFTVTPTDNLGITDTVQVVLNGNQTPADTVGLTDALTFAWQRAQALTETLGLSDGVAFALTKALADTLGLTDSIQIELAGGVVLTDPIGLTDSLVFSLSKQLAEDLGVTDAALTALSMSRLLTDTQALSDAVALAQAPGVTDSAGLTDELVIQLTKTRPLVEVVGLTDSILIEITRGPETPYTAATSWTASTRPGPVADTRPQAARAYTRYTDASVKTRRIP